MVANGTESLLRIARRGDGRGQTDQMHQTGMLFARTFWVMEFRVPHSSASSVKRKTFCTCTKRPQRVSAIR